MLIVLKKFFGLLFIAATASILWAGIDRKLPLVSTSGTGAVTVADANISKVTITVDSASADSSYGTFMSTDYDVGDYTGILAFMNLWKISHEDTNDTNFPSDTLIAHLLSDHGAPAGRDSTDTIFVDTLVTTEMMQAFFDTSDGLKNRVYWVIEAFDSTTDAAHHGEKHHYYLDFEVQKKR